MEPTGKADKGGFFSSQPESLKWWTSYWLPRWAPSVSESGERGPPTGVPVLSSAQLRSFPAAGNFKPRGEVAAGRAVVPPPSVDSVVHAGLTRAHQMQAQRYLCGEMDAAACLPLVAGTMAIAIFDVGNEESPSAINARCAGMDKAPVCLLMLGPFAPELVTTDPMASVPITWWRSKSTNGAAGTLYDRAWTRWDIEDNGMCA